MRRIARLVPLLLLGLTFSQTVLATDSHTCQICEQGTFCFDESAYTCPQHSTSPAGSTSADACVCHAGYYMEGGSCLVCPGDFFCTGNNNKQACPANTKSQPFSSSEDQCLCDVGFHRDGQTCVACAAGSFKNAVGDEACTLCAAGTYQTDTAQTACTACPANTNSPEGSPVITQCTSIAGYFAATAGVAATACPAGTYQGSTGQTSCLECSALGEYYSPEQAATTVDVCQACPVHSEVVLASGVARATTVSECKCSVGYTGADGGPCNPCAVGTYKSAVGADACAACPPDTFNPFQSSVSVDACQACPQNSQSPAQSSAVSQCICVAGFERAGDTCVACAAGSVSVFGGTCSPCAADTYQVNASHCAACPVHTTSTPGSPSAAKCVCIAGYEYDGAWRACLPCVVGTFNAAINSSCVQCAVGKYAEHAGLTSCAACTADSTTESTGAAVASACQCNAGFEADGGACTACAAGTYSTHNTLCEPCAANTFSATAASSACTDCHANSESPANSDAASDCICSAGHYLFSTECAECVSGSAKGTAGNEGCELCAVGKYAGSSGATTCTDCPTDTFMASAGASVCTVCPDSSVSEAASSSIEQCLCLPGFYRDGDACVACAFGTYKTTTANEACEACSAGYYTASTGETAADACLLSAADRYVLNGQSLPCHENSQSPPGSVGQASCLCNAGFTKTGAECTACTAGTYKEAVGDGACTACAAGFGLATPPTVPSVTHEHACEPCPANTYSDGAGSALVCQACPAHSQSAAESSSVNACRCKLGHTGPDGGPCTACVAGKYKDVVGAAACELCGSNTYNPDSASESIDSCRACPINSTTALSAAPFIAETQCVCRDGFERVGSSPAECVLCTPGSWGSAQQCFPCPADTYYPYARSPFSAPRCTPCPGNSTSPEAGFTLAACVCDAGFVRNTSYFAATTVLTQRLCELCPAMNYCPTESQVLPCRANSHSAAGAVAPGECVCDAGFAGADCLACAEDFYCPGGAAAAQLSCAANASSVVQSSSCTCDPGFYLSAALDHDQIGAVVDPSGASCTLCPPDSFCYVGALLQCPQNSSSRRRSDDILDCECHAGFERVGEECVECPPTKLCVGGNDPAKLCAERATADQHVRCLCPAGSHCGGDVSCEQSAEQAHSCASCPPNYFCSNNEQHACPAHMTSPANSTSTLDCFCADGAYRVNNDCLVCPIGSYCHGGERFLCSDLDPHAATIVEGAILPTECLCEHGRFRLATHDQCKPCPSNFFCPPEEIFELPNVVSCIENALSPPFSHSREQCFCPVGFRLTQTSEIMKCIKCNDGERCEDGEVFICAGANRVASLDHSSCVCDAGFTELQTECQACIPGTIKPHIGIGPCNPCPADTFWINATYCAPCPADAESKPGSLGCTCLAPKVLQDGLSPLQPVCAACERNEYYDNGVCASCPTNSSSAAGSSGIAACACDAGHHRLTSSNGTLCQACPAGAYEQHGQCQACPARATSPVASYELAQCVCNASRCQQQVWGSYDECSGDCANAPPPCEECEPGFFKNSLSSADVCEPCPSSTFQAVSGSTACVQCAANSAHFLLGQASESSCKCVPGFFRDAGVCTACAPGTFKNFHGDSACLACDLGFFADAAASTACTSCAQATMYATTRRASNITLQVGSPSVDNCTCTSGVYLRTDGNTSACQPCLPGSYKTLPGFHECNFCGADSVVTGTVYEHYYGSALPGAKSDDSCKPCPALSGQDPQLVGYNLAMTSPEDCLCFNGHTDWSLDGCSVCPPFQQKLGYSNEPCSFCSAGYYFVDAFHACEPCELSATVGQHELLATNRNDPDLLWGVDQADCRCRLGFFRQDGDVSCHACPLGQFRGDRTVAECTVCAPDTFANATAQTFCHACPANSSTLGASGGQAVTSCICDLGMQFDETSRSCELCPAGKFRNDHATLACQDCGADEYSESGAVHCSSCPDNERSLPASPDISKCSCKPGFGGKPGSSLFDACLPCPAGSFSGGGSASVNVEVRRPECLSCPSGKNSSVASTEQLDCKCYAGHGVAVTEPPAAACVPCASGFFSPGGANTPCLSCGFGAVSDVGSDHIDDCECDARIGLYER